MRLIEARTAVVGRFVLYPLVCAVLAVASRSTLFDEWRTPPGLLAIFGLLGAHTVICSWILVRSANAARSEALAVLRRQRWETFTGNVASPSPSREAIDAATDFIDALRDGAFAPLSQHPILGAVLVPAGSLGLLTLVDMLQRFR